MCHKLKKAIMSIFGAEFRQNNFGAIFVQVAIKTDMREFE